MKKKILLSLAVIVAISLGVVGMSAFEAHVINITAKIENALGTSLNELPFGTVFPQEYLIKPLTVFLSSSFMDTGRVDDVHYIIKQKIKPCPVHRGDCTPPQPNTDCAIPNDPTCVPDTTEATPHNPTGFHYLSLCSFLSKAPDNTPSNDTGELSYFQNDHCLSVPTPQDGAIGYLSKAANDTSDTWNIDLKVPPIAGNVAQDWPTGCPTVTTNSATYGCDLWVEVTEFSPTKIGANLATYVAPTSCNVNVSNGGAEPNTIVEGIADADPGNTVCVAAGTYGEDVVINKSITLAGANPATTIINGQVTGQGSAVTIAANNVTLEGFTVNGAGIAALWLNTAVSGANVHDNHLSSAIGGNPVTALTTQGLQSNDNFTNNEFTGNGAGQLAYVNGEASLGAAQASDNVDFIHNTFDGTIAAGGEALGNESTNSNTNQNVFKSTLTSAYAIAEAWKADAKFDMNNFDGAGGIKIRNSDGSGTVNAKNNWWGAAVPVGHIAGLVDDSLKAAVAFPEN